jgi:hypothetical protein
MSKDTAIVAFVGVVVIFGLVLMSPFVTIWALNTLFKFTIEYTFWTWLAALWLSMAVGGSSIRSWKKS